MSGRRASRITPDVQELRAGEPYELVAELDHGRIVPFLLEWLRAPTPPMRAYWLVVLLGAIGTVGAAACAVRDVLLLGDAGGVLQIGGALLANVTVLLVAHELVHAAAYRAIGARRVSFGADWRHLVFYAIADGFVVGRRHFYLLAVAPFVALTAGILGLTAVAPAWWRFGVSAAALHALHCAGDAALVAFAAAQEGRELYTYDDAATHRSYFYVQR